MPDTPHGQSRGKAKNHAYVIDHDYRVVYLDRQARRVFPHGRVGAICYESFRGRTEPCRDCPWNPDEPLNQTVIYSNRLDQWYSITCLEIDWPNCGPAVLFAGHPIDESSRNLFYSLSEPASYNELFELNLTTNSYKILYHEPDTFITPPSEGDLSVMFDDVLNNMIAPDDRERFTAFWDFDTLLERLEKAGGTLHAEFRKKLVKGGWGWASQTVVPVKRGQGAETVIMCFIADIDEKRRAQGSPEDFNYGEVFRQLKELDSLTGIYNAATFFEKAEELLAHDGRAFEAVAVDIEHFKIFNEWHGREAGDRILMGIAERLEDAAQRFQGLAGYLGGDDFVAILPAGTVTEHDVEHVLEGPPFDSEEAIGFLPAVGVCAIEGASSQSMTACDHAAIAMNEIKGSVTRRVGWYENDMAERMEREAVLLRKVKQALKNRELVLYWQPQCSTRTGRIVGLEALVRWQHPLHGLVMPGEFIPVLESNGFIASLDLYVWEDVCRHLRSWIDRGGAPVPVSVNVSRADLYAIDIVDTFESLIRKYDLTHDLLEIEITESAYAEDQKMADAVNRLKELGFTILMDDFGTGYSSLNMLKDINVDIIKIDMGFLNREHNASRGEGILQAIVSMARLMNLRIIAEGAETEEQVELLKSIGCDYAQGYYFHRPMPTDQLEALLTEDGVVDQRGLQNTAVDMIDMEALFSEGGMNQSILENLIGGMAVYAVYEDRFELLQVNNAYYRVTGCNPVDLKERQCFIARQVHPDDLPKVWKLFDEAEAHPITGAQATVRRYRLNGDLMLMRLRAFFLSRQDSRRLFYAAVEDATDQADGPLEG